MQSLQLYQLPLQQESSFPCRPYIHLQYPYYQTSAGSMYSQTIDYECCVTRSSVIKDIANEMSNIVITSKLAILLVEISICIQTINAVRMSSCWYNTKYKLQAFRYVTLCDCTSLCSKMRQITVKVWVFMMIAQYLDLCGPSLSLISTQCCLVQYYIHIITII